MALTRWDPFRNLNTIHHPFDRLFAGFGSAEGETTTANWVPSVDILENESDVIVRAEVPGVDPKKVDLSVTDNVLTISGERKFENEDRKENYHRVERVYGTFSRSFTLPRSIDDEGIQAEYKDGILTVRLPKHQKARARQIKIAS